MILACPRCGAYLDCSGAKGVVTCSACHGQLSVSTPVVAPQPTVSSPSGRDSVTDAVSRAKALEGVTGFKVDYRVSVSGSPLRDMYSGIIQIHLDHFHLRGVLPRRQRQKAQNEAASFTGGLVGQLVDGMSSSIGNSLRQAAFGRQPEHYSSHFPISQARFHVDERHNQLLCSTPFNETLTICFGFFERVTFLDCVERIARVSSCIEVTKRNPSWLSSLMEAMSEVMFPRRT